MSTRRMRARPIRAIIRRHQGALVAATLLHAGHLLGEAGVPVIVGATIGAAVDGGTVEDLLFWLALLAADFVLLSLCWRFGARRGSRVSLAVAHELRLDVIDRVLADSGRGHSGGDDWGRDDSGRADSGRADSARGSSGELVSVVTSDARRVGDTITTVISAVVAGLVVIVTVVALLSVSLIVSAVVVVVAVVVLLVLRRVSAPLEHRSSREQHEAAQTSALATDLFEGARTVIGLGAEQTAADRYRAQSRRSVAHAVRAGSLKARLSGLTVLIVGVYIAVVTAVAGTLALAGAIGVGELVAILGLAQFILGPLETLGGLWLALARGRASARRITAVLTTPSGSSNAADPAGGSPREPPTVRGEIGFESVTSDHLDGVNLRVTAGSFHVVVTADPQDAVELAALLSAVLLSEKGVITLDGRDSRDLDPLAWRASVVVAPHATTFFGLGPAESVAAVIPAALDGQEARLRVERALTAAAATGFGDAPVEHRLSGGELQRVALARALATDASVLVLSEPTTAVDSVTELFIADACKHLRAGRTTIVLTSSPAFVRAADEVTFIADGRVEADGSHVELFAGQRFSDAVLG